MHQDVNVIMPNYIPLTTKDFEKLPKGISYSIKDVIHLFSPEYFLSHTRDGKPIKKEEKTTNSKEGKMHMCFCLWRMGGSAIRFKLFSQIWHSSIQL